MKTENEGKALLEVTANDGLQLTIEGNAHNTIIFKIN